MRPWPEALASSPGFHKPEESSPYRSALSLALGQGGSLASSGRESIRQGRTHSSSRRPAVVGLVDPPYGLPSTDPTTPAPSPRYRELGPASLRAAGSRWWSAHADNSTRGGNSPLNPLPLRVDRPLRRPISRHPDCRVFTFPKLPSARPTAPWRRQ
jgi:hypothetical protein